MLVLLGIPIMCVEQGLGQFSSLPIVQLFAALNFTYAGESCARRRVSQREAILRRRKDDANCLVLASFVER